MTLKTTTLFSLSAVRVQHQPFVPGTRVRLLNPAPGHIEYGVVAGTEGTVHAGPADESPGLMRVLFDSGREFWCDSDSLEFM